MHSHKISAKLDNGNTSKQALENQRLLEAEMEVKVHASINFSTDYENSSVFWYKFGQRSEEAAEAPFQKMPRTWVF